MAITPIARLMLGTSFCAAAVFTMNAAWAQQAAEQPVAPPPAAVSEPSAAPEGQPESQEAIVVTGTRIKAAGLSSVSPVSSLGAAQISLGRAVTVENFSTKLPQLAGGVNATSAGSDSFGAQTLDLRNLGQNRTLVLINGTRAVPFSFRNAVDVNTIPAPLLKRVDVLTGGAAAVYGADAVAGVVNFVVNDRFEGLQASANYRNADGGASQYGVNLTGGLALGDRGNVAAYLEYTQRDALLVGSRDYALLNPTTLAGNGGNFTDVASGRTFSFDDLGNFTRTAQRTNYTPQFILAQPLRRYNASLFFNYDLLEGLHAYGRALYSNVQTTGASRSGQQPPVVNQVVGITSNNPFLPAEARNLLTFVNGVAQVNVNRSLGELGVITADNNRNTYQLQLGFRGPITKAINWDAYVQYGKTSESITVNGDGLRSVFPTIANSVDIFGPGADLSALAQPFDYGSRRRTQLVSSAFVSGDSSDVFALPAGPVGFTLGYEYRREVGTVDTSPTLSQSFNQGTETPFSGGFRVNEVYGELLVPILQDLPFIKNLSFEGAYRHSWYSRTGGVKNNFGTSKLAFNWVVNDDIRFRGTRQIVIRDANIGEFGGAIASIPFRNLVTVSRLRPRYQGDPCALGTGNLAQCQRFGAPPAGSYDSLDPNQLTGGYFFGGNPQIRPERGTTYTVGAVLTPHFVPGLTVTVDYYNIRINDAVGQIQPVDALTSCYITDPRADNPLCQAVTRDPATGRIFDGFPIDRNLAAIKQQGVDIEASYRHDVPFGLPGKSVTWQYQTSLVGAYSIQRNPVLDPIDCRGTYASRCSSDGVSLVAPDYRHRASVTWDVDVLTAQLGWTRIGSVRDSTVGSTDIIPAQNYFDLNFSVRPPVEGVTVNFGVENIGNVQPPVARIAGAFNTYPDTYDVLGRRFGFSVTIRH